MGDIKSSVPQTWNCLLHGNFMLAFGGDNVYKLWILRPANAPLIFIYDAELIFMKREEECLLCN